MVLPLLLDAALVALGMPGILGTEGSDGFDGIDGSEGTEGSCAFTVAAIAVAAPATVMAAVLISICRRDATLAWLVSLVMVNVSFLGRWCDSDTFLVADVCGGGLRR